MLFPILSAVLSGCVVLLAVYSMRIRQKLHARELTLAELTIRYEQERNSFQEKIRLLEEAKQELTNAFKALSADALQQNNQSFLTLAQSILEKFHLQAQGGLKEREVAIQNLVEPIKNTLGTMQTKIDEIEKSRIGAYESLRQQVTSLMETQKHLRDETVNLSKALRAPSIRGRWGEMQLRRVVELAGLNDHCDFSEQAHMKNDYEDKLRPDMIIHLPGKKSLVIDAKVPLTSYLNALEAKEEKERILHMQAHAKRLREHIDALSKKQYWSTSNNDEITPEFTILFLPGDPFLSAALEINPDILEESIRKRIIIATPATLIALLHAVAYSWRQEALTENARKISSLGAELYKRLGDMGGHMQKLGSHLEYAVQSYNRTVGSMETRVLSTARRFKDLQVVSTHTDIESLTPVSSNVRSIMSQDMKENSQNTEKLVGSNKK